MVTLTILSIFSAYPSHEILNSDRD